VADPGLIRNRLRAEIEAARRTGAERRARASAVSRAYDVFLENLAIPVFRTMANVLRAEGIPFEVQTPSGAVRLVADRTRDDAIEMVLDATVDPPQPMFVTTRTRGSRLLRTERPVKERASVESISEDEVIEQLIEELRPWLG
jgi:hypothetical protein